MAETTTPNYKWIKPDIGGDASNWGNVLNATTDAIDSVVYANQRAGVPIGSIVMWAGNFPPPTNWLGCIGVSLDTTTYAKLFAIIGYTYGGSGANFNLPDLRDIFPIGASATRALAAKGGAATVTLDATMIPNHTHTATSTQPAHTHTASQGAHNHGDPGHTHGVSDPTHAHSVPGVLVGGGAGLGFGSNYSQNGTAGTTASGTGISIAATGTGIQAASAGAITVSTVSAGAITTTVAASTGGGQPHTNMPPWLGINFIIRFQ